MIDSRWWINIRKVFIAYNVYNNFFPYYKMKYLESDLMIFIPMDAIKLQGCKIQKSILRFGLIPRIIKDLKKKNLICFKHKQDLTINTVWKFSTPPSPLLPSNTKMQKERRGEWKFSNDIKLRLYFVIVSKIISNFRGNFYILPNTDMARNLVERSHRT